MSAKPIIPRTRAEQDIDEAITHYLDEQAPGRHQDSSTRWKPRIATLPAIPLPVPADTRTSWISRTCARGLCRATLSWFSTSNVHNTSTYGACFIPGAICRPGCRNQAKEGCPQAPLIHPTTATTNYGYSKLGKRGPHGPASSGDQLAGGAVLELGFLGRAGQRGGRGLAALDGLGHGVEVAGADFALVLDRGETDLGGGEFFCCSSTKALIWRRA